MFFRRLFFFLLFVKNHWKYIISTFIAILGLFFVLVQLRSNSNLMWAQQLDKRTLQLIDMTRENPILSCIYDRSYQDFENFCSLEMNKLKKLGGKTETTKELMNLIYYADEVLHNIGDINGFRYCRDMLDWGWNHAFSREFGTDPTGIASFVILQEYCDENLVCAIKEARSHNVCEYDYELQSNKECGRKLIVNHNKFANHFHRPKKINQILLKQLPPEIASPFPSGEWARRILPIFNRWCF